MEFRKLNNDEIKGATKLIWNVFIEFEAKDYTI